MSESPGFSSPRFGKTQQQSLSLPYQGDSNKDYPNEGHLPGVGSVSQPAAAPQHSGRCKSVSGSCRRRSAFGPANGTAQGDPEVKEKEEEKPETNGDACDSPGSCLPISRLCHCCSKRVHFEPVPRGMSHRGCCCHPGHNCCREAAFKGSFPLPGPGQFGMPSHESHCP